MGRARRGRERPQEEEGSVLAGKKTALFGSAAMGTPPPPIDGFQNGEGALPDRLRERGPEQGRRSRCRAHKKNEAAIRRSGPQETGGSGDGARPPPRLAGSSESGHLLVSTVT